MSLPSRGTLQDRRRCQTHLADRFGVDRVSGSFQQVLDLELDVFRRGGILDFVQQDHELVAGIAALRSAARNAACRSAISTIPGRWRDDLAHR